MTASPSSPVVSSALSNKLQMDGMGAIVFWEMSDTRITPDALRGILAAEGITTIVVPDIDPESAVKRAARTWAMGRGNDRFRADIVKTPDLSVVKICILHRLEEGSGKGKRAKWETVETVLFDLTRRTWTSSAQTQEVRSFIASADDFIANLDHNFIRPSIIQKRLAEMKAFSLKSSSGLWYVTQSMMEDLARLQRIVTAIGNSQMFVVNVGASSSSREAIQSAAASSLQEGLEALESKLDAWVDSTRKIRSDAIDTALVEFADLIERADLYQGALQVRMGDLTARIEASRDRARQIIDGNLDAHSNPETKPLGKRALQVLEAVEAAFPEEPFTIRALEEIMGLDAGQGALQTHLRDICRVGKAHRQGREAETGAMIYGLGAGDGQGPSEDEDEVVEVSEAPTEPQDEMELVPAKEPIPVEPQAQQEEPSVTVIFPTDEELAGMSRTDLRQLATNLRDSGVVIPRASKLGRTDLTQAIVDAREAA